MTVHCWLWELEQQSIVEPEKCNKLVLRYVAVVFWRCYYRCVALSVCLLSGDCQRRQEQSHRATQRQDKQPGQSCSRFAIIVCVPCRQCSIITCCYLPTNTVCSLPTNIVCSLPTHIQGACEKVVSLILNIGNKKICKY